MLLTAPAALADGVTGGLPPLAPRPSASLFKITPTQALYISVKSVSIFRTMHCTVASLSAAFGACNTVEVTPTQ